MRTTIAIPFSTDARRADLPRRYCRLAIAAIALSIVTAANAATTYAGAFNGPRGTNGSEQSSDAQGAHASTFYDNGTRTMFAEAKAAVGQLGATANASNTDGGFQFATADASFTDSFQLYPKDPSVNHAQILFTLQLEGGCVGSPGATNGTPNAACGGSIASRLPSGYLLGIDHAGEVYLTLDLEINSPFGGRNVYGILEELTVTGYATNGVFSGDFANTARLFIDSVTPGVSVISESGHDYATVVPEPTTAAMFVAGVLCFGALRTRSANRINRRVDSFRTIN